MKPDVQPAHPQRQKLHSRGSLSKSDAVGRRVSVVRGGKGSEGAESCEEGQKKQKKAKKAKKQRLTAHAALDLTPAGEPAPAPAPVAETLDDRVRLLAARGASDAEIGRMLREAAGAAAAAPAPINDGFTDAERAARAFSAKVKGDESAAAALRPLPERRRRRRSRSRSRSRGRRRRARGAAARGSRSRSRSRGRRRSRSRSPRSRSPGGDDAINAMLGSAARAARRRSRSRRSRSWSRSRSRSRSYSSRSSYSRSRSPVPRRPPPDARNEFDRLKGGHYEGRADDDPYWEHDQYDPHAPPPERVVDERYEPPQPDGSSKAGGVCIANPRAWMNERRAGTVGEPDTLYGAARFERGVPVVLCRRAVSGAR